MSGPACRCLEMFDFGNGLFQGGSVCVCVCVRISIHFQSCFSVGEPPVYGSWLPQCGLSQPSSSLAVWQPTEFYVGNLRNLKRQNANAAGGDFLVSLQGGKAPCLWGSGRQVWSSGSGPRPVARSAARPSSLSPIPERGAMSPPWSRGGARLPH